MNLRWVVVMSLLCAASLNGPAAACSIPVFRYALERWTASPYEVLIFRSGPLTEEQDALRHKLETAIANVTVIDANVSDARYSPVFEKIGKKPPLPFLALRYPGAGVKAPVIWTSPLTEPSVEALLHSPARQTITERLGRGETAVLVLIESGDKDADEKVAKMLETERPRLERNAPLPEPTDIGPQPLTSLPMKVSFSMLRLARDDPRERAFLAAALKHEPGVDQVKTPIVVAVFGRGRLLAALHSENLTADELPAVARYLCGACTCQVKEATPGVDLLFAVDWDAMVRAAAVTAVESDSAQSDVADPPARFVAKRPKWLWPAIAVVLAINVLAAAWALRSIRRPAST